METIGFGVVDMDIAPRFRCGDPIIITDQHHHQSIMGDIDQVDSMEVASIVEDSMVVVLTEGDCFPIWNTQKTEVQHLGLSVHHVICFQSHVLGDFHSLIKSWRNIGLLNRFFFHWLGRNIRINHRVKVISWIAQI